MRTEPLFNIETPDNPYELKSAEKNNFLDKDESKKNEEELKKEKDEKEKQALPPDPFSKKGKRIDVIG